MSEKDHKYLPIGLLILLALVWGSSFILIKYSLAAFAPGQVGALRLVIAGIVLSPWAFRAFRRIPTEQRKFILVIGIFGNFMPSFLFAWAQTGLASSLTGVLNALTPLFTLIVGIIAFSVPFRKEQLLGLMLGFAGSFSISLVGSGGALGNFNAYALLVVGACLCYAISANTLKNYLSGLRPLDIVSLALVAVAPIALGYLLSTDFIIRVQNPESWRALGYLAILAVVGTALALIAFNKLIQITSAVFATSVTYVIPIVAVFWGLVDGEHLYPLHYVGMGLILIGVYLTNKSK